jgi:hypothetical protein
MNVMAAKGVGIDDRDHHDLDRRNGLKTNR